MKNKKISSFLVFSFMIFAFAAAIPFALAQAPETAGTSPSLSTAIKGMTLWQVIQAGGIVMAALGVLSLLMTALVIFMFLRFNQEKLLPVESTRRLIALLRQKRFDEAEKVCATDDSPVSNIVKAGLSTKGDLSLSREYVEMAARKEVTSLWTLMNYLSEVAQISPMMGLLGTVLGMIQAFNTIAFDSGVVKPIMLAGGVAKAMITTAGGLTIAIAAMIFYSLLRPRVQNITNLLETITTQISESFSK